MSEWLNLLKVLIPTLLGVFTVLGYFYKKVESAKDQRINGLEKDVSDLEKSHRSLEREVSALEAKQVDTDQINRMLDQRLQPMQHQLQQILDILMKR